MNSWKEYALRVLMFGDHCHESWQRFKQESNTEVFISRKSFDYHSRMLC